MKRIAVGILAHVDSGKTTLSEGMLYCAGEIRKLGRVDHGDAFLDSFELEKNRGITIFSKQALMKFNDTIFTLLDTPGHVDFSSEMERTIQVMDYAILVISGTDGVQSHTETLWNLLTRYNVPTYIFVNKMDITKFTKDNILSELKNKLSDSCIDFSIDNNEQFYENVAMCNEKMMNQFLDDGYVDIINIASAIKERKIFPCYFGSALKTEGINEFINGLDKYTCEPQYSDIFGAKVFKISEDEQKNRLTYMKITGGKLKVKALLGGLDSKGVQWSEKANQIRVYSGTKFNAIDEAEPGTICAVTGLTKTFPGEGIGAELNSEIPFLEPVMTYKVKLPKDIDAHNGLVKLRKIEEEEPQLHIVWDDILQEIKVQLMGEVQLEILKSIVKDRFGFDIDFGQGSIVYKETIAEAVEGVGHYEPLKHYAEVHLLLEPGERGSGLKFFTNCREDNLDKNWQRLILTHLEEKTHVGVLTGSPITDIRITLLTGKAHIKHTEGGDFRQATYRAVRQGLRSTESILLEPWYEFKIEVPAENIGRTMSDIQRMNGVFSPPEHKDDMAVIEGSAPAACMREYQKELIEYTRGKGRISISLKGYEPCHNTEEVILEKNYDCDADLNNSADSIFCSHGTSITVKWNEVREHMHVDSGWGIKAETNLSGYRAGNYCQRFVQDEELMKIFEKTFGPVKRDIRKAFDASKNKPNKKPSIEFIPSEAEYLLVDGYNIIFAWDELKKIAKDNLDAARNRLMDILCNYQGFRQCNIILVFDGYKVKGNIGEVEKYHNITIVYTKEAETADMYIEKTTHNLSKNYRVKVATSDRTEQIIIMGKGAIKVSAEQFKLEVDMVENAIRDYIQQQNRIY